MVTTSSSANASAKLNFGLDAPRVIKALVISGVLGTAIASCIAFALRVKIPALSWYFYSHAAQSALTCLIPALLMVRSSRVGKPRVVASAIANLQLSGNERALDAGCGRGQVLIELARALPSGHVTGIDAWSAADLTENSIEATQNNAKTAGVADRIQIDTGDIRALPYEDDTFDLITANLVVHNLKKKEEREQAIAEFLRVLKPGGRLLIIDFRKTGEYIEQLSETCEVTRSGYRWQMFPPVRIVQARLTRS